MTTRPRETSSACHSHQKRTYRQLVRSGLATAQIKVQETDLSIHADCLSVEEVKESVLAQRGHLEVYMRTHPLFMDSLVPLPGTDSFDLELAGGLAGSKTQRSAPVSGSRAITRRVTLQTMRLPSINRGSSWKAVKRFDCPVVRPTRPTTSGSTR